MTTTIYNSEGLPLNNLTREQLDGFCTLDICLRNRGLIEGVINGSRVLAEIQSVPCKSSWVGKVVGSPSPGVQIGRDLRLWRKGQLPVSAYNGQLVTFEPTSRPDGLFDVGSPWTGSLSE